VRLVNTVPCAVRDTELLRPPDTANAWRGSTACCVLALRQRRSPRGDGLRTRGNTASTVWPRTGKRVRYIGITNQVPEMRLRQHLADCGRGKNLHKENWLRRLHHTGRPNYASCGPLRAYPGTGMHDGVRVDPLLQETPLIGEHACRRIDGYAKACQKESKEKHRVNTEKGLMESARRAQEAEDMRRGYCMLAEWGRGAEQPEAHSENAARYETTSAPASDPVPVRLPWKRDRRPRHFGQLTGRPTQRDVTGRPRRHSVLTPKLQRPRGHALATRPGFPPRHHARLRLGDEPARYSGRCSRLRTGGLVS